MSTRRISALAVVAVAALALVLQPLEVTAQVVKIDLGDVTAGGDGTGTADPAVIGIHPDTGALESGFVDAPIGIGDGQGLTAVADGTTPYIDSVFLIDAAEMPINSAGAKFPFPAEDRLDPPQCWGQVLRNRIGGEVTPISIGGKPFETGVGIHAVAGITYDLDALRSAHGAAAVGQVTAFAGAGDSAFDPGGTPGFVTTYIILSDDTKVIGFASHKASVQSAAPRGTGKELTLPIPPEAKYLTLAAGAGNGSFYFNSGAFGGAMIGERPNLVPALSVHGLVGLALMTLALGAAMILRRRAASTRA
ncbi:MAG: NPCBM/NEW2 domain-containing protein [Planctomycetes bacterium]|nr:NPCBM/NEW2 domain-containing protein [Planctomycetota bacterium]